MNSMAGYHLRQLEKHSGEKWIRLGQPGSAAASRTLRRREKRVMLAKRGRALCTLSVLLMAVVMIWFSIVDSLTWLQLLWLAIPLTALRFYVDLVMLEKAEDRAEISRNHYQKILEQELNEVLDR